MCPDTTARLQQNSEPGRPLLVARGICKSFLGQAVLCDASFVLREGQTVILRGDNGSGKTTLLNILSGALSPDSGELEVRLRDKQVDFSWGARRGPLRIGSGYAPEHLSRAGLGRLWQDVRLFSTLSVLDNIRVSTPRTLGDRPWAPFIRRKALRREERAITQTAMKWLQRLGIADRAASSCDRISFGQMKRVALARLMQANCSVLLLDEPLAGLDAAGRQEILKSLRELSLELGFTLVIVEHVFNLPDVLPLATDIWTLENGVLRTELVAHVIGEARSAASDPWQRIRKAAAARDDGEPLLSGMDLVVDRGLRRVLDGYTMTFKSRGLQLLEKPNGWGKTTLLDALAGLLPIHDGTILFKGQDISRCPSWSRARRGISYLRSCDNIVPGLTVREHLELGKPSMTIASVFPEWQALLPPVGRRADSLSGGERQRLALGRMPVREILMMDEPFRNLDATATQVLEDLILRATIPIVIAVPYAAGFLDANLPPSADLAAGGPAARVRGDSV